MAPLNEAITTAVSSRYALRLILETLELRSPDEERDVFDFVGPLEPRGLYGLPAQPTAVIKYLKVPAPGRGVGSFIVTAWEQALSAQGINVFAATNIKDEGALEFWEKSGYIRPSSELNKRIPYVVYKELERSD